MRAWARIVLIVGLMLGASSTPARAESLPHLIPRLIEQTGLLQRHDPSKPAEQPSLHVEPTVPSAWLGSTFRFSLLARDWREAYSITDGHPLVFDRMRMVRSSRMAVSRVSLVEGRIVPFVELAAGQWRIDPDLMPNLPRDTELAAQLGVGFEWTIAKRCAFAWDVERTSIYHDTKDGPTANVFSVVATFVAVRAEY